MSEILRIEGLTKYFGGLRASYNINFVLGRGMIKAIIGPNGAGKTTFISQISGHYLPSDGQIWFEGEDITKLPLVKRARRGIVRKFQTPSLYLGLNVYENVEIAVLGTQCPRRKRHERIAQILHDVRLSQEAYTTVSNLSHGQRQWLEIGLLLGREAKLLLLDEPTAGMTPDESHATGMLIKQIVIERDLSAIIIEHDMEFVERLDVPVSVLHLGELIAEGTYKDVESNETVQKIYIGE